MEVPRDEYQVEVPRDEYQVEVPRDEYQVEVPRDEYQVEVPRDVYHYMPSSSFFGQFLLSLFLCLTLSVLSFRQWPKYTDAVMLRLGLSMIQNSS